MVELANGVNLSRGTVVALALTLVVSVPLGCLYLSDRCTEGFSAWLKRAGADDTDSARKDNAHAHGDGRGIRQPAVV